MDILELVAAVRALFGVNAALFTLAVCGGGALAVVGSRKYDERTKATQALASSQEHMALAIHDRNRGCDNHLAVQQEMVASLRAMQAELKAHTESTHRAHVEQVRELVDAIIHHDEGQP